MSVARRMTRIDAVTGKTNPKGCQGRDDEHRARRCGRRGAWYTSVRDGGAVRVPVFRCTNHVPEVLYPRWELIPRYIEPSVVLG